MSSKIKQLNNLPTRNLFVETAGCGYEEEVPGEGTDLDLGNLKSRVRNFKSLMTSKFSVPVEALFNIVVFDIENAKELIRRNPNAKGLRVYLSKYSPDKNELDYELIVVPCKEGRDKNGNKIFIDLLEEQDVEANLFITYCRRPPGCPDQGALLNEDE